MVLVLVLAPVRRHESLFKRVTGWLAGCLGRVSRKECREAVSCMCADAQVARSQVWVRVQHGRTVIKSYLCLGWSALVGSCFAARACPCPLIVTLLPLPAEAELGRPCNPNVDTANVHAPTPFAPLSPAM